MLSHYAVLRLAAQAVAINLLSLYSKKEDSFTTPVRENRLATGQQTTHDVKKYRL